MLALSCAIAALVEDAPRVAGEKVTTRHVLKSLDYRFAFEQYAAEYAKVYTDDEKPARKSAFEASLAAIKEHNEMVPAPSWFMGLSAHSDKSASEWKSLKGLHRGLFHSAFGSARPVAPPSRQVDYPNSLDWRNSGVVTPIKDQESCGSCWAFSSAETVESAYGMATLKADGKAASIPLLSYARMPSSLLPLMPRGLPPPSRCSRTRACAPSAHRRWLHTARLSHLTPNSHQGGR